MDGIADVDGLGAHPDRQRDFANHVARVGVDDAAPQERIRAIPINRRCCMKETATTLTCAAFEFILATGLLFFECAFQSFLFYPGPSGPSFPPTS